jgi:nucleoside phosphorylase
LDTVIVQDPANRYLRHKTEVMMEMEGMTTTTAAAMRRVTVGTTRGMTPLYPLRKRKRAKRLQHLYHRRHLKALRIRQSGWSGNQSCGRKVPHPQVGLN